MQLNLSWLKEGYLVCLLSDIGVFPVHITLLHLYKDLECKEGKRKLSLTVTFVTCCVSLEAYIRFVPHDARITLDERGAFRTVST